MRTLKDLMSAVLVLLGIALVSPVTSNAQCPPGWLSGTITIPVVFNSLSPPCASVVTINYCYPGPSKGPTEQLYIYGVTMNPPCGTTFTPAMMREIGKALLEANPRNFYCSPCPLVGPEWQVGWASCAKNQTNPDGSVSLIACSAYTKCIDKYNVCCDAQGNKIMTWVGSAAGLECGQEDPEVPIDPACGVMCFPSGQ